MCVTFLLLWIVLRIPNLTFVISIFFVMIVTAIYIKSKLLKVIVYAFSINFAHFYILVQDVCVSVFGAYWWVSSQISYFFSGHVHVCVHWSHSYYSIMSESQSNYVDIKGFFFFFVREISYHIFKKYFLWIENEFGNSQITRLLNLVKFFLT